MLKCDNYSNEAHLLENIYDAIRNIEMAITGKTASKEIKFDWIENDEFLRMMKISPRTAQYWRDTGIIRFSKIGSVIYYSLSDVNELMERRAIKN